MRIVIGILSLVSVLAGFIALNAAEAWAEGFDINKKNGLRWWSLYVGGIFLLAIGALAGFGALTAMFG